MTDEQVAALPRLSRDEFLALSNPWMSYVIAIDGFLVRDACGIAGIAPACRGDSALEVALGAALSQCLIRAADLAARG